MGFISDTLFYLLVTLYALSATFVVVYLVGWFTCTDYYYKINAKCGIFPQIFCVFSAMLGFILSLGYFAPAAPDMKFIIAILMMNGLAYGAVVVIFGIEWLVKSILKSRQYFADKRGRS